MKNIGLINFVIACLSVASSISTPSQNHNTQDNQISGQETKEDASINTQIMQQQKKDADTFMALLERMANTGLEKKEINPKITCKNCTDQYMSLGTLEGCILMWGLEAISHGHSEFEKIRELLESYIKQLSDQTSVEDLKNFLFSTAVNMKQACFKCKKIAWQK